MAAIVADRLPRASARRYASPGFGVGGLYELRRRYRAGRPYDNAQLHEKQ